MMHLLSRKIQLRERGEPSVKQQDRDAKVSFEVHQTVTACKIWRAGLTRLVFCGSIALCEMGIN